MNTQPVNPAAPAHGEESPQLWGVVVTYRRLGALRTMLERIAAQTRPPDHLLVVDNASDPMVRESVLAAGATYLDATDNLGPAGGIALGMGWVLARAAADDWIVLFDDDDPPIRHDVLCSLWEFGQEQRKVYPRTGGVGMVGSRYDTRLGVFRRVPDEQLRGAVPVDNIGGNQFPMYLCEAVRVSGPFDSGLFWGFEEGEFGLRMKKAGYSIVAHGDLWRQERGRYDRLNLDNRRLRTPENASAWRRYYSTRNATLVARRYGGPVAAGYVALGKTFRASLAMIKTRRPLREILLPALGALHGLRGRTGRVVDPGLGDKTSR